MDIGILRRLTNMFTELNGEFFENIVISEIIKIIKQLEENCNIYHLRSKDGREIDLLLEIKDKIFAFECKVRGIPNKHDARHLKNIEGIFKGEIAGKFIIHNGDKIYIDVIPGVHAVPAKWLFSY